MKKIKIVMCALLCICLMAGFSYRNVMQPYAVPQIQSLNNIPDVVFEYEDENSNIDVTVQIDYLAQVQKQIVARMRWLSFYGYKDIDSLNAKLAEIENIKLDYCSLAKYTYAEWRMLAVTVAYEAGYCCAEHQEYVAQVLINRCSDERFNDNIYDNLMRPMQYNKIYTYASEADKWKEKDPVMWESALHSAQKAMMGLVDMPSNVIFQSEFSGLGTGTWKIMNTDTGWYCSTTYFNYG